MIYTRDFHDLYLISKRDGWIQIGRRIDLLEKVKHGLKTQYLSHNTEINRNWVAVLKKNVIECSKWMKRQRTQDLRANYSTEELSYAAQMSLCSSRSVQASKIVKKNYIKGSQYRV